MLNYFETSLLEFVQFLVYKLILCYNQMYYTQWLFIFIHRSSYIFIPKKYLYFVNVTICIKDKFECSMLLIYTYFIVMSNSTQIKLFFYLDYIKITSPMFWLLYFPVIKKSYLIHYLLLLRNYPLDFIRN